jgi:hypothetical protein
LRRLALPQPRADAPLIEDHVMVRHGEPVISVVMESSGHYWWNLASHCAGAGMRSQWSISARGEVLRQEYPRIQGGGFDLKFPHPNLADQPNGVN